MHFSPESSLTILKEMVSSCISFTFSVEAYFLPALFAMCSKTAAQQHPPLSVPLCFARIDC